MSEEKKIIRFCYRKIIDSTATAAWDRYVFDSSYNEYLLQVQLYDQAKKYATFAELVQQVPAASKLHFLVSASVVPYLQQLNNVVPDIVNSIGKRCLNFDNYQFEIINSDLRNKKDHVVAISFYTGPLLWHDTVGDKLLVSSVNDGDSGEVFPDLVALQPFLGIYSLKKESI